jgi:phosphoglycerate kinase
MSTKKSISDLQASDLKGKKVLVRCDLNVPLDGKTITDDTRIRSSIPTIEYLAKAGAIVTVCSHLGRPKDGPEDKFSLGPCGELSMLLFCFLIDWICSNEMGAELSLLNCD